MPIVTTRLEILQVRKLIQCVRNQDSSQIEKMVAQGIPGLVNFQGIYTCIYKYNYNIYIYIYVCDYITYICYNCFDYVSYHLCMLVQLLFSYYGYKGVVILTSPTFYIDAEKGYTALHVAVILNLDHVVTQLLDNGASTSVQDLEVCIYTVYTYMQHLFIKLFYTNAGLYSCNESL